MEYIEYCSRCSVLISQSTGSGLKEIRFSICPKCEEVDNS